MQVRASVCASLHAGVVLRFWILGLSLLTSFSFFSYLSLFVLVARIKEIELRCRFTRNSTTRKAQESGTDVPRSHNRAKHCLLPCSCFHKKIFLGVYKCLFFLVLSLDALWFSFFCGVMHDCASEAAPSLSPNRLFFFLDLTLYLYCFLDGAFFLLLAGFDSLHLSLFRHVPGTSRGWYFLIEALIYMCVFKYYPIFHFSPIVTVPQKKRRDAVSM